MQFQIANKTKDGPNTSSISPFNASGVAAAERDKMYRQENGKIHFQSEVCVLSTALTFCKEAWIHL